MILPRFNVLHSQWGTHATVGWGGVGGGGGGGKFHNAGERLYQTFFLRMLSLILGTWGQFSGEDLSSLNLEVYSMLSS